MNGFGFFYLITAIFSLTLGIYVYTLDKRNIKNIVFLWFSINGFYLAFVDFGLLQAESLQMANIWLKLGAIWPITVASIFHFCVEYTERDMKVSKKTLYLFVYLIAIVFSLIEAGNTQFSTVTLMEWGWIKTFSFNNSLYTVSTLYSSVLIFISVGITLSYALHETNHKKRMSAGYVTLALLIPIVIDTISDTIIPLVTRSTIPNLTNIAYFFCLLIIAFAMRYFQLFQINPSSAADNIVETMQDMLVLTSIEGKIQMVNHSTLKELGFSDKKVMINNQISNFINLDKQLLFGPNQLKSYETTFNNKNKDSIPVLLSKSLILNDEKNPVGSVFIGKNITTIKETEKKMIEAQNALKKLNDQLDLKVKERTFELRKAHNELQELNKNLERKVEEKTEELTCQNQELISLNQELTAANQELTSIQEELETHVETVDQLVKQKDEFIHMLGHDLKNPMTSIFTLLPIVQRKVDNPRLQEMMTAILKSTKRMKEIIDETLKLARLNDVGRTLNLEKVHFSDLINQMIDHNNTFLEKYNMTVNNNVNEDILVNIDTFQFEELLTNLLTNAVKYTTNDNNGLVNIDAIEKDDIIEFSFSDNGIGMASNQLEHVFEKFYKAGNPREGLTSSGLGLSICDNIIQKHKGKIWVESKGPGKGSTFYFTLPKVEKNTM